VLPRTVAPVVGQGYQASIRASAYPPRATAERDEVDGRRLGRSLTAGRSPPEPNRKLLSLHIVGVLVCDFNVCFRLPLGSVSLHRVDVSDRVDQLFRILSDFEIAMGAATISSRGNVLAMIGRNAITARSRAGPQWHLRQDRYKLDPGG
jgi:hypothetical protein